jgi:transcriptional regulator with GAF, ATPase, and Fis domain
MKKLQSLFETLLAEVERDETEHEVAQAARPLFPDLRSRRAQPRAEDQLRASELARTSRLSRFQEAEIRSLVESCKQIVAERTLELTQANAALAKALNEVETLKERLAAENAYWQAENNIQYNFGEVIGQSEALKEVFFRIETVAPQDSTVLLLGETGTGKGMMARAIHTRSPRKDRPMVMVNCTALPASLIESELFGREKGAYTGASAQQIGRFELADKGTLFLDEIGDLPLELQAKLLQVLQDKEFCRLGSPRTIKVNVRIIAATNRDLKEAMAQGRFREDLFYRLNIFPVLVPPLRQRRDDIPLLVEHFMRKFCRGMGKDIKHISAATMKRLVEHAWPGNVRELENVIERAVITTTGDTLQVLDRFEPAPPEEPEDACGQTLEELERATILKVLRRTRGRIEGPHGAAVILGLNPSTLRGRMRKEGLQRYEWLATGAE